MEEVNAALKKLRPNGPMKGYPGYTEEELVSTDFKGIRVRRSWTPR